MLSIFEVVGAEVLALAIGVLMAAAWLVGHISGRSHANKKADDAPIQGKVTEACLAIFGLILAFSFGTAYAKFESRRQTVVREAVSISTFWTRIELLPDPLRSTCKVDLREYVWQHLDLANTGLDIQATRKLDRSILSLQDKITNEVVQFLQQPENRLLALPIMGSMNDMMDQYEIRAAARLDHVPTSVVLLLVVVSVISAFMIGRSQGVSAKSRPWVTTTFLLLVVSIIYITFDLDQPWYGLSKTSQVPMIRLARSIGVEMP